MKRTTLLLLASMGLFTMGCDNDQPTTVTPPVYPGGSKAPAMNPPAQTELDQAAADAKAKADEMAAEAKAKADEMAADAKAKADVIAGEATHTADDAVPPPEVPTAGTAAAGDVDAAAPAGTESVTEARSLLTQVLDYIKAKKWDDAEATLKKLEGMRGSLPEQLQSQIDSASSSLKGARNLEKAKDGLGDMMK
jgi:cell division septum initiation protein DivIVA